MHQYNVNLLKTIVQLRWVSFYLTGHIILVFQNQKLLQVREGLDLSCSVAEGSDASTFGFTSVFGEVSAAMEVETMRGEVVAAG